LFLRFSTVGSVVCLLVRSKCARCIRACMSLATRISVPSSRTSSCPSSRTSASSSATGTNSNDHTSGNDAKQGVELKQMRSERRKHSALAVVRRSRKLSPRRRPPSRGAGRPKCNQLEMVTTFTYRPSLVKIDACNFELSW